MYRVVSPLMNPVRETINNTGELSKEVCEGEKGDETWLSFSSNFTLAFLITLIVGIQYLMMKIPFAKVAGLELNLKMERKKTIRKSKRGKGDGRVSVYPNARYQYTWIALMGQYRISGSIRRHLLRFVRSK